MKYVQPFDQPSNPTAPYVDLNAATGVDGSIPPGKFFNALQAEVLAVITAAGLTPDDSDLTQLYQAILALIPPPSGGPADASLVHFGVDTGSANALIVTPSPTTASVAAGFTLFCIPAAANTGAATLTINLSPSGSSAKAILRDDLSALAAGDIAAGRLAAFIYDGTRFRLAWVSRGTVTDNYSILGNGQTGNPLRINYDAIGPGVNVGQFITSQAWDASSWQPNASGYTIGKLVSGSSIVSASVPGISGSVIQEPYVSNTAEASWFGAITGTWKLQGFFRTGGFGLSYYQYAFVWVRVA